LATSHNALGILYRQLTNTAQAIEAFEQALKILEGTDNRYRTAQIYNNLGLAYADERQWQNSEQAFRASLSVKEMLDDEYGQAKTLINLVRTSAVRNMLDEAIALSQKAIGLFSKLGARFSLAQAHRNLGKIYRKANQPELAESELHKALELFRQIHDEKHEKLTESELNIGRRKDKLPWWAKVAIVFFALFILLIFFFSLIG
jgi:tetratricopeptide (TPR) repeat protein